MFWRWRYCRAYLTFCGITVPVDVRMWAIADAADNERRARRDPWGFAAATVREPGSRRRIFSRRELRRRSPALAAKMAALAVNVNAGALVPDVPDDAEMALAMLAERFGVRAIDASHRFGADELIAFTRRRLAEWKQRDKWEFYLALLTQIVGAIGGAKLDFQQLLIDWDARPETVSEDDAMYELANLTGATIIDLRGTRGNDDNDA